MDLGNPDRYPYRELAARTAEGQMRRKHFVAEGDTGALAAWCRQHRHTDIYQSMGRFSARDLKSPGRCGDFVVDIDSLDLAEARKDTLTFCDRVMQRWDLRPGMLDLFFSGGKGFHVILRQKIWDAPPDLDCLLVWRHLARRFKREIGTIDTAIYEPTRLIRLVNTVHSRSGLYKIAVSYEELRDYGLEFVLQTAKAPREFTSMAVADESPKAVGWLVHDALPWIKRQKENSRTTSPSPTVSHGQGWWYPYCLRAIELDPTIILADGTRHAMYKLLSRFYAKIGMSSSEAEFRIRRIDQRNPIQDPDFISRYVHYSRQSGGRYPCCRNDLLRPYCNEEKRFRMRGQSRSNVRMFMR